MKKFFVTTMMLLILIALAACNGSNDTPELPSAQNENIPATSNTTLATDPAPQSPIDQPRGQTIEELGAIIVAAGEFWNDWWNLRGAFAWEHIDELPWDWGEEPYPLSRGMHGLLLPSSGFETTKDIALYLQQFYTDSTHFFV